MADDEKEVEIEVKPIRSERICTNTYKRDDSIGKGPLSSNKDRKSDEQWTEKLDKKEKKKS